MDLLPTLLDLAGVDVPEGVELDGRSLVPLLEGDGAAWPERTLYTHRFANRAVGLTPGAVRTQRYRAVNEGEGWELFDMAEDPGQARDVSEEHPELVEELARDYQAWFDDVTREGYERFPIPVGHPQENPVALPVTQADFEGGPAFKQGRGWANDWLTEWTSTDGTIAWDLDVVEPGEYEVVVEFLCPEEEAGARVRVSAGPEARVDGVVPGTAVTQLPSPDRFPRVEVYEMEWERLTLGTLPLPGGPVRLTLEAVENPGGRVMDVMAVWLEKHSVP